MFIAQIVPAPATATNEQAVFFFLLAGSLAFLLWCGVSIVTVIATLRRKPSIEAEFATKNDLSALKAEFHREIGKIEGTTNIIFQKIDQLSASVTKSFGDIQRDLGRLEGPRP
jgi:biopolymer transport protein ExbB/TolQ